MINIRKLVILFLGLIISLSVVTSIQVEPVFAVSCNSNADCTDPSFCQPNCNDSECNPRGYCSCRNSVCVQSCDYDPAACIENGGTQCGWQTCSDCGNDYKCNDCPPAPGYPSYTPGYPSYTPGYPNYANPNYPSYTPNYPSYTPTLPAGYVDCTPNVVLDGPGDGTTTVTWNTINTTTAQLWVWDTTPGANGSDVWTGQQGSSGTFIAPWIKTDHTYLFRVKQDGNELDREICIRPHATGQISASPNPVPDGPGNGTTTVTWNTTNTTTAQLWVWDTTPGFNGSDVWTGQQSSSDPGQAGATNTYTAPWIQTDHSYLFRVKQDGNELARTIVTRPNAVPIGTHDAADCTHIAGWACDQSNYSIPLRVDLYKDGPYGTGTFLGSINPAQATRTDVASFCGGYSNHGFDIPTSTYPSLIDGTQHSVYAYALNIFNEGTLWDSTGNPLLNLTPKSLTCAPPVTCDTTAVGSNQLIGCLWDGINFNTLAAATALFGSTQSSPVADNPPTTNVLDYTWANGSPNFGAVGDDTYSIRWKGNFTFKAGTYTFYAGSDDGLRLKLDGVTIIDQWIACCATWQSSPQTFTTQTSRLVELEYNENGGFANVNLRWTYTPPATSDLSASIPTYAGTLIEGNPITFASSITNSGGAAASNFTYRFCIDNLSCLTTTAGRVGTDGGPISVLAGATSPTLTSSSWTATVGSHTIYICADVGAVVTESNENNNCSSTVFNVAAGISPWIQTTSGDIYSGENIYTPGGP